MQNYLLYYANLSRNTCYIAYTWAEIPVILRIYTCACNLLPKQSQGHGHQVCNVTFWCFECTEVTATLHNTRYNNNDTQFPLHTSIIHHNYTLQHTATIHHISYKPYKTHHNTTTQSRTLQQHYMTKPTQHCRTIKQHYKNTLQHYNHTPQHYNNTTTAHHNTTTHHNTPQHYTHLTLVLSRRLSK